MGKNVEEDERVWEVNEKGAEYLTGRGAQLNTRNPYLAREYVQEHFEGLDDQLVSSEQTVFLHERPKAIVNKVESPDIHMLYSMNPYQGCEHGCVYCYARNSHQYWGYSAGLDFERRIIVKENAPELLEETFRKRGWKPAPIMLSGNTDCYQPIERKLQITRRMLAVLLRFRHPVGIITKNALILRDLDYLKEMASIGLVHASVSITSLDESLRRSLEPRTSTSTMRLRTIEALAKAGIPTNAMIAPIIPSLNSHEVPEIMRRCADAGASSAGYTMVRLNGAIGVIFEDWLRKNYPDRAEKVLGHISAAHGGSLGDSRYGVRMRGEGNVAESMQKLFRIARKKYFGEGGLPPYNLEAFQVPPLDGQLSLF